MANNSSPAFQLYAKDFLVDEAVIAMSLAEVGAYFLLLCHAWLENGIPDDLNVLARLCRVSPASMRKIWLRVGPQFQPSAPGRLVNRRMEEERRKLDEFKQAQSESGRVGAEKRWGRHSNPNRVAINSPMAENSSSSSSPIPTPITPPTPSLDLPGFENFWEGFVVVGKPMNEQDRMAAAQEWISQELEPIAGEVCAEVRREILNGWDTAKRNGDLKFIPAPVNWLKKKPWTRRKLAVVG